MAKQVFEKIQVELANILALGRKGLVSGTCGTYMLQFHF